MKLKRYHKCLILSEIVYFFARIFDRKHNYRINIIVTFYGDRDKGHAWVTRDGKDFMITNPTVIPSKYTEIGSSEKYRYFVKESNLHRLYSSQNNTI